MGNKSEYKDTIKSSGYYGISQFINALLGVVRSKITALLIGTEGVGILGLLQSIMDFFRSTTGLGLDTTAVKQIATAQDQSTTLTSIKKLYFLTATLGALLSIIFSKPLSIYVFDNTDFQLPIVFMSITLIFITLTAWIVAAFQGLKQIKYLSYAATLGSLLSFLALIPAYWIWGIKGIVPMFIGTNAIIFLVNYYFYRKLQIKPKSVSWKKILKDNRQMILLGGYLVVGGFIFSGSILLLKAFINNQEGLQIAGIYQAIWVITSLCWTLILKVANAYYFPQLCSISKYRAKCNLYINQQSLFLSVLILPVILGLCFFSKQLLYVMYSSDFTAQHQTLFLHLIGAYLKIIITPLALLILAKGRGFIFVITELVFWLTYFVALFLLYSEFNLLATGISYVVAYALYIPMIVGVTYHYDKAYLSKKTWIVFSLAMVIIGIFIYLYFTSNIYLMIGIVLLTGAIMIYSLNKHIPIKSIFHRKK